MGIVAILVMWPNSFIWIFIPILRSGGSVVDNTLGYQWDFTVSVWPRYWRDVKPELTPHSFHSPISVLYEIWFRMFQFWNLCDFWPRSEGQRMTLIFDTHLTSLRPRPENNLDFWYSFNFINWFSWVLQPTLRPKAAIILKEKIIINR